MATRTQWIPTLGNQGDRVTLRPHRRRGHSALVNSGGHTWPGGAPVNPSLGVTTSDYGATATIRALV
jgi:hypothetical protein